MPSASRSSICPISASPSLALQIVDVPSQPSALYTLLILVRNIVAGFDAVPPEVREAADAMGMTRLERLRRIELPLAIPLIVAGLRLATVSTIGLVMIVTLIGNNFGGLGLFIKEGIQSFFATEVYVGAVLSVTLAVIADIALVRVERALTPWAHARAHRAIG